MRNLIIAFLLFLTTACFAAEQQCSVTLTNHLPNSVSLKAVAGKFSALTLRTGETKTINFNCAAPHKATLTIPESFGGTLTSAASTQKGLQADRSYCVIIGGVPLCV